MHFGFPFGVGAGCCAPRTDTAKYKCDVAQTDNTAHLMHDMQAAQSMFHRRVLVCKIRCTRTGSDAFSVDSCALLPSLPFSSPSSSSRPLALLACVCVCLCLCVFRDLESGLRKKCSDLKDGERSLREAKSGETVVEASSDTDVHMGFGAKDKRKHLTAGSLQNASVCSFKTSPYVPATRPHVFEHTAHTHTTTTATAKQHNDTQRTNNTNNTHAETQTARWNTTHAKTYGDVLLVTSCEREKKQRQ